MENCNIKKSFGDVKVTKMKISNTTIKRAKQQFKSKIVEDAKYLLENETMAVVYGEFIDDSDNEELKQCLLFMLNREQNKNK